MAAVAPTTATRCTPAIAAVQALKAQGAPPAHRGLIETCEESGSYDLLPYIDALRAPGNNRLGDVGLVVCLDSGAGNYDQLWLTTSLRGMASGTLKVEILTEGIHSGDASGLVPSSFRIMRQVLDRLEDSATGRLLPASFHCEVPADRLAQAQATAAILGEEVYKRFPWAHYDCGGSTTFALPTTTDPCKALLNRTWLPTLSASPAPRDSRPSRTRATCCAPTAFKLSLRLPPLVDAAQAVQELKGLLEDNAPYQAKVTFDSGGGATGWNAPCTTPWFETALNEASQAHFGAPCGYIGQGGTIPLMNMLSEGFPKAQMMVCGVLGPPRATRTAPTSSCTCPTPQAHRCRGPGDGADALRQPPFCTDATPMPDSTLRSFTAHDGSNLAVMDWPLPSGAPSRGLVVIVHGLGEHAGRYDHVAERLNSWGFAVRSYDQHGHGESDGKPGALPSDTFLLDNLAELLDTSRRRMDPRLPLVLMGHSLGGLVAARLVSLNLRQVDGLVLSSPALDAGMNAFQKLLVSVLPRLAPDLRVGNGLDRPVPVPRCGTWCRPTATTRWCTTASAPAWRASLPTRARPCWPAPRSGGCPRCCSTRAPTIW
jgi:pimeloyl-ACP methyl ester carboxylesterase/acetylornithine deacetylase/succinyl-diaminopimelate desuccinylase-like protein